MKKIKKVMCCFLSVVLLLMTVPTVSFATYAAMNEPKLLSEVEAMGGTFQTIQSGDNTTIRWRSADGSNSFIMTRENNRIYLNGQLFQILDGHYGLLESNIIVPSRIGGEDVVWGNWNYFDENLSSLIPGAITLLILATAISLASGIGVDKVAAAVGALGIPLSKIDKITIDGKNRYGYDDEWSYFEQYTNLYINGELVIEDDYTSDKIPRT